MAKNSFEGLLLQNFFPFGLWSATPVKQKRTTFKELISLSPTWRGTSKELSSKTYLKKLFAFVKELFPFFKKQASHVFKEYYLKTGKAMFKD